MKALVIGATGATGQALLPLLIAAPAVERVDSFGRRAPDLTDAKLHSHIIDFHQPQQWADRVQGDAVFICLGTTLKAAGSKAAQWQIDYQAALDFARALLAAALDPQDGVKICSPEGIRQLLQKSP